MVVGTDGAPNTWIWWATLVVEDLFMLCSILSFIPLILIAKYMKRLVLVAENPQEVIHLYDDKPQTFETDIKGDQVKVTRVDQ